ncbi:MAG: dihydroorotase [Thiotrichales bacterium]|jgi:dihydroorotase|nr:dihydroorotase [Thiotrichales bacterium]MBT3613394.1 dihydroorotase [Thiotrichales bacterium]MBT3752493.1 dihydroorotase [Thiotrichales bacterium]MBT3837452.1 dihydroorotase [Thiotrichales bacterium]MBT4151435.1 dihydroorotase [Thiotrichales bacterium]
MKNNITKNSLTITRPDDWHLHLRDGTALKAVLPDSAHQFGRAIIMPNLSPPVSDSSAALLYKQRITDLLTTDSALNKRESFEPLMTIYLTDNTTPEMIAEAVADDVVVAAKLYPAGATTNSDLAVTNIKNIWDTLEKMAELEMPLLLHGEVTTSGVDIFDREACFIDQVLSNIVERIPQLRIVLEHITTKEGVEFVESGSTNIAATITAHHLLISRNAMFQGGMRPHYYCLPLLKREEHRIALLNAATSGNPKFFLGTDSAPHPQHAKESGCGCAGIYTAHAAIELYAEAFESVDKIEMLEGFSSFYGADFYRLPHNIDTITLHREEWEVPNSLEFGTESLIPFRAGEKLHWKML